jgi:hypothetical protein
MKSMSLDLTDFDRASGLITSAIKKSPIGRATTSYGDNEHRA